MEGVEGVERRKVFLAMCNGVGFEMNDLVDVFVGTVKGVRGNKSFPIKGRFKGVRVEQGQERFLCRPIVGSQKGRCPSFPPESCLKVKAFGSDVYGERRPLHFSKLRREVQDRFSLAGHACAPGGAAGMLRGTASRSRLTSICDPLPQSTRHGAGAGDWAV